MQEKGRGGADDGYAIYASLTALAALREQGVPHARCVMHVHPTFGTVLASLADSSLRPIDQNTATFFRRTVIDEDFAGLAFEDEGTRCASLLTDPKVKVMIMGNHGVLVLGKDVADAFNRMYYFEKAAETYIKALWTQKPLRVLSDQATCGRRFEHWEAVAASHSESEADHNRQENGEAWKA